MQTIFGARLIEHAARVPPRLALAMPGREISYRDLLGQVRTRAVWLVSEGCRPREVIGVTISDEIEHLVVTLALLSLGIPHVCLPTHDPAGKRLDTIGRLGIKRIVISEARNALPNVQSLPLVHATPVSPESEPLTALDDDPDAPAIYYTSSGTTGQPKLYALSQRALAWRAESIAKSEQIPFPYDYRSLTLLPIEEVMAKSRFVTCAYLGATSVLRPGPAERTRSVQQLCAEFNVSCLELGVLQIPNIIADRRDPSPLPATTMVYTAGSRVPSSLRREFKDRFGVPLWVHYGAREFGRITCTFPGGDDDHVETVGRPVPWIDLEIVDADGTAIPAGNIGEIRLRSECMTREYHGNAAATALHFRDGWFYPRDLVSLTADGRLCLHGRADDMMNLNGIKIFPGEIERVLEEHPAVKAAAAFSKASTAHGDIPVAAVELHAAAHVDGDELIAYARSRLGVRSPRKIFVIERLPRNTAGKFVKRDLLHLVSPGK